MIDTDHAKLATAVTVGPDVTKDPAANVVRSSVPRLVSDALLVSCAMYGMIADNVALKLQTPDAVSLELLHVCAAARCDGHRHHSTPAAQRVAAARQR